ncbi:hypothetical protein [Bacillus rubiinfantis]|uniref:hypothetical protein n=1 Tax=Bacillus rubiinfantis TaxID=1499680 RepID=UPI0005AAB8DF|nr:hypothetical protein [Bacillus rubiinfantis]
MAEVIFALLSLIILAPLLILLKLNITMKGKLYILALSLLVSLVGLVSKSIFTLWQAYLILLLFILLIVLLAFKKLESIIFMNDNQMMSNKLETQAQENPIVEPVNETFGSSIANHQPSNDEVFLNIVKSLESVEEDSAQTETLDVDEIQFVNETNTDGKQLITETLEDENNWLQGFEDELQLPEGLEERDNEFDYQDPKNDQNQYISDVNPEQEPVTNHYMEELEQLIFEDETIAIENENNDVAAPELAINLVETSVSIKNEDSLPVETEDELKHSIDFIPSIAHKEVAVSAEVEEFELAVADFDTEERMAITTVEMDTQPELYDEKEAIHKQFFATMLSQIELKKKIVDDTHYEQFLKECLHPELPVAEYYTFAILLARHYLSTGKVEKLPLLLDELEEKVTNYPILLQEIQFFKSLCSKKQ